MYTYIQIAHLLIIKQPIHNIAFTQDEKQDYGTELQICHTNKYSSSL